MIGLAIRAPFLLAVVLTSSALAQDSAPSRTGDPGPIVDPVIVGTWSGSLHLVILVRFDIGTLGQLTVSFDGAPSAYLLEANDGRWVAEPIRGGEPLSGTYEILKGRRRLAWGNVGDQLARTRSEDRDLVASEDDRIGTGSARQSPEPSFGFAASPGCASLDRGAPARVGRFQQTEGVSVGYSVVDGPSRG
jgi:hypothetical protein